MKKLTILFMSIAIASMASAVGAESEEKTIYQMLGSLKMEKLQAELVIETMARRGKLNSDQATKALREVASVKEEDAEAVKAQAVERLSSKNSYATK